MFIFQTFIMKKILLIYLSIILSLTGTTQLKAQQDDFNTRFDKGYELITQKRFSEALAVFNNLLPEAPDMADIHTMISWCNLFLGNGDKARQYAENAIRLEPANQAGQAIYAYMLFAGNQSKQGWKYMETSLWLSPDENSLQYFEMDFADMAEEGINPGFFNSELTTLRTKNNNRNKAYQQISSFYFDGINQIMEGNTTVAYKSFNQSIEAWNNAPPEYRYLQPAFMKNIIVILQNNYEYGRSYEIAEKAYRLFPIYGDLISPEIRVYIADVYATSLTYSYNWEQARKVLEGEIGRVNKLVSGADFTKGRFLYTLCRVYSWQQESEKLRNAAAALVECDNTLMADWYDANGYNFLGSSYINSTIPANRQNARQYYEKAYDLAVQNRFDDLTLDIKSNLALSYWQSGQKEKAAMTYIDLAEQYRSKGDLSAAEEVLNNLGAFYLYDKNYQKAVDVFKEAVAINEELRKSMTEEQKIRFQSNKSSAYIFLSTALARMNSADELFRAINDQRARVLAEELKGKGPVQPVSMNEFRNYLDDDEAAIFYSMNFAGSVIILVVTKTGSLVREVEDYTRWVSLKDKFLDRMMEQQAKHSGYQPVEQYQMADGTAYSFNSDAEKINMEDFNNITELARDLLQATEPSVMPIYNEFFRAYYDFLIAPVSSALTGKEKLLIFPDGILNFLPFEALLDRTGRYLIESFDISYSQSAEVLKYVNHREYSDSRKPFLGMGGPIYEEMIEAGYPMNDESSYVNLYMKVKENTRNGRSQREAYATLFDGAMSPLPGTLKEVQILSEIFPDASIYTSTQMTEENIKKLASSGELSGYKIVHLATHGFAIQMFPELSGIAMCIFSRQRSEDGYLTAPEIADLNMNADLVVLSACETGLGKIYNGEGVDGLTRSLLIGGANEAVVSLWPVSDQGTMLFMTGMYTLTEIEGIPYSDAVNIMKRKFINGEFGEAFSGTNFWAPYVIYGK